MNRNIKIARELVRIAKCIVGDAFSEVKGERGYTIDWEKKGDGIECCFVFVGVTRETQDAIQDQLYRVFHSLDVYRHKNLLHENLAIFRIPDKETLEEAEKEKPLNLIIQYIEKAGFKRKETR